MIENPAEIHRAGQGRHLDQRDLEPLFDDPVLENAEGLYVHVDADVEGGVTYEYANALILGRAQMRAEQLQTDLVPLAVWDGKRGDGPGGTA